jgi:ABC-type nitrate/sulfonate/bicarbonate transport system permease component
MTDAAAEIKPAGPGRIPGALRPLLAYAPLLILAAAWEASSRFGLVSPLALPPLSDVAAAWVELARSGELLSNATRPLPRRRRSRAGRVVGGALGIAWRAGARSISCWGAGRSVLSDAEIGADPGDVLWLGFGDGSKILLIFLGCMLPVTIGAYNGARGSDRLLMWSARSMGASRLRTVWDVVVPSALPEMLNGVRTALALSFILLVSSELIAARQGLGYLIGALGANGSYEAMFAVVLTVAMLGFIADRIYQAAVARAMRWRQ